MLKRMPTFTIVELDGVRYTILRERDLIELCRRAKLTPPTAPNSAATGVESIPLDGARLAERMRQRRRQAGLTQAALARRAGIRVETLNRIERGRTTPDFSTIRKLVVAMSAAEASDATSRRSRR